MKRIVKKCLILLSVLAMTFGMTACSNPLIFLPFFFGYTTTTIQNEADNAGKESDAATVDSACKIFYAGVVSGVINSSNASSKISSKLPSSTADNALKKQVAKSLTVQDAMIHSGLTSTEISGMFFKESDGMIEYFGSHAPTGYQSISLTTTLGELYGYGASSDTYESSSSYNNEFSYPSYDY